MSVQTPDGMSTEQHPRLTGAGTDPSVPHITLCCLLGFVDDRTVISWT